MAGGKKKPGPKLKYNTAAEMQKKIDEYFKDCEGRPVITPEGDYQLTKWGELVREGAHPPTPTGLALWLGFANTQSLLDYQKKEEFEETILTAKARCREYAEQRLFDRDGARGAEYALSMLFGVGKEEREAQKTNVVILPDVLKEYYKTSYDESKE